MQIHSGLSGENIGLLPPTDVKFSVSIDSDRRDVNRDYIVEYVSDLNGFRVKVEIAQRGLEPGLRGFGGGAADGGALSPDTLKSGAVINLQFVHLVAQEPNVVFLPEIQANNFQLLSNPNPNEYRLNLNIPDSLRSETIAFKPVTGLNFSGSVSTYYKDVNKNLIVDYVADVNGNRVKVRTEEQPDVQRDVQITPVLSVDVLKSGGG
uniref:Uncharacterized protein n=1 Tax=Glossina morsitans morsitans TaxID=37546 RepID=A0A1B0FJ98_GLOMM